jgi:hypothetical protein
MKYKDVDYLIKLYIYPLLEEECRKLKIPKNFISGVYGCYTDIGISGYVEEIKDGDKIIKVRIRIGDCNNSPRAVLKVFFHEMYHVKELLDGKKKFLSELLADLYAERRILQFYLNQWISRRKKEK